MNASDTAVRLLADNKTMTLHDGKGRSIETPYTDAGAAQTLWEWYTETTKTGWHKDLSFVNDLINAWRKTTNRNSLSPGRRYWLHRLAIAKAAEEAGPAAGPEVICEFKELSDFLTRGEANRKTGANLTFANLHPDAPDMTNGGTVQIKYSPNLGGWWISDGGEYGSKRLYGKLMKDGRLMRHRNHEFPTGLMAMLDEMNTDIVAFVQKYGRLSGQCCFCRSPLDDPNSVNVGYGPVCAKNYGLPHEGLPKGRRTRRAVTESQSPTPARQRTKAPQSEPEVSLFASDLGLTGWPETITHDGVTYRRGGAVMIPAGGEETDEVGGYRYVSAHGDRAVVFND